MTSSTAHFSISASIKNKRGCITCVISPSLFFRNPLPGTKWAPLRRADLSGSRSSQMPVGKPVTSRPERVRFRNPSLIRKGRRPFDGSCIVAHSRGNCRDPYRPTLNLSMVRVSCCYLIEPIAVDIQRLQRISGDCPVYLARSFHRAKSGRGEQGVGNTRGTPASKQSRLRYGTCDIQDIGRTENDTRKGSTSYSVHIDTETGRRGLVKPLVVAPISVNGFRSIWMERALGPLSIMISIR